MGSVDGLIGRCRRTLRRSGAEISSFCGDLGLRRVHGAGRASARRRRVLAARRRRRAGRRPRRSRPRGGGRRSRSGAVPRVDQLRVERGLSASRSSTSASARSWETRDSVTPSSSAISAIGRSARKYCSTTRRSRSGSSATASVDVGQPLAVLERPPPGVGRAADQASRRARRPRTACSDSTWARATSSSLAAISSTLMPVAWATSACRRRPAERRSPAGSGWRRARGRGGAPSGRPSRCCAARRAIAPRMRVAAYRANGTPALGVEGLGGLHEGGEAGGAEVVAVDVGRHPGHGLADDVSDQGHVHHDQRPRSPAGRRS